MSSATGIAVRSAMGRHSISPINGDIAQLPGPRALIDQAGRRHPQAPRSQPPACPPSTHPAAWYAAVANADSKSPPPGPGSGPGTSSSPATGPRDWSGVSIET